MKKTLINTALLAMLGGLAPAAFAQADHAAHHGAESAPVVAEARLAEGTVKNYVSRIMDKLHVRTRAELAVRATSRR